jgi:hypothetical protein
MAQTEAGHPVTEGIARDPEGTGGAGHVAVGLTESGQDLFALESPHGR